MSKAVAMHLLFFLFLHVDFAYVVINIEMYFYCSQLYYSPVMLFAKHLGTGNQGLPTHNPKYQY